ncbi:MAG: DUF3306 domain-containing protein [Halomonas sp.]|uniref:DUF3306 domain-containing protein n=1 Tax=Halomonas sp. TaxID=1486246 RepID=UPI0028709377|nr:DUF3306 domain-containing protein [Halomonas sp.]MDR9439137.1 DUF3306 domain-containing protein [Halomonas sp.]
MSRLERWSRLKRGEVPASSEMSLPPRGTEAQQGNQPDREPLETDHPERAAAPSGPPAPGSLDHTLPDPDTLPAGSDIKAYMSSGVSRGLRKRALRRLFAADHYGIRDGLDDYDDDYREKLQPLASEVAERLRNWTRQHLGDDEAPADHATETSEASRPDVAPGSPGRMAPDDEADMASREQTEDENREELSEEAGRPSSTP